MTLIPLRPQKRRRADKNRLRRTALALRALPFDFDVSPAGQLLQGRADALGVEALAQPQDLLLGKIRFAPGLEPLPEVFRIPAQGRLGQARTNQGRTGVGQKVFPNGGGGL